jgi:hypothetical protein
VIRRPDFRYSGNDEEWRDNVKLLFEVGRGLDAMRAVIALGEQDDERSGKSTGRRGSPT